MDLEKKWKDDLLGYEHIGSTFGKIIHSIDETKVISIEAGFGRGKTFFRKAWAEQLREAGETVVEVDVLQSDHSGDPMVTLLGALVAEVPQNDIGKARKALKSAKKIGAVGLRASAGIILRNATDEFIEVLSETAIEELGDFDHLDDTIKEFGQGMSKAAGLLISAQLAAERVRKKELPEQLATLRKALLQGKEDKRVVVIIDELDRCHPDYALTFVEAMKLVFSQSGFVFCLMINAEYMERLAKQRFGAPSDDEKYLDKFVDIRLSLSPSEVATKAAAKDLAMRLPNDHPYGDSSSFSSETAAELVGDLALRTSISMRTLKRLLLKVEIALRCYSDRPLDLPLLIFLAFKAVDKNLQAEEELPRAYLTPEVGEVRIRDHLEQREHSRSAEKHSEQIMLEEAHAVVPELLKLPADRYGLPEPPNKMGWALAFKHLAPRYIPDHQAVLDGVASFVVVDADG